MATKNNTQAIKVAASNTLKTRVVKDKTKYTRKKKHKNNF